MVSGLGRVESLVIHDLEPTPHRDPAAGIDGMAIAARHLEDLAGADGGFAKLQVLLR